MRDKATVYLLRAFRSMQRLTEDDIQIVQNVTPEMWDQMRELMRTMPWTTQDEAMWQLIPEMKNVFPIFAFRRTDKHLLGGLAVVMTDIAYGAFYVMHPNARGQGVGMKITTHFMHAMSRYGKRKPVLGRGVKAMIDKYSGPPFYSIHLYEMYAFTLSREELLHLFPCSVNILLPISLKEMTAEQFEKVCDYDQLISGRDRRAFLKEYHSLFLTKGVALFDAVGNVQGLAGAVPTLHDSHVFKIGPIFAATRENACYLLKCITEDRKSVV